MQKAKKEIRLRLKRLIWLAMLSGLNINSAVTAAETFVSQENIQASPSELSITGILTNFLNTVPLNTIAWLSLSVMMFKLFLIKNQSSKQSSLPSSKQKKQA